MSTNTTLDKVGKWGSGGTPLSSNPDFYNGDIPWLIIEDLNDHFVTRSEKSITELGLKNSSAKLVPPNTLLVAMYGSIGKLGINKIPVAMNQAIAYCQPYADVADLRYLFFFLLQARKILTGEGRGGTQQNISQEILKAYPISLPKPTEQKRIAAILDKADRQRRQRRFAQTLSDSFLQSVFIKMFGDPVANTMNWDSKLLNGLCRNITDGTHHTPERVKKGVPFITSKNVRPFRFDLSNLEFVSEETHAEIIKRCNPAVGDVLYTNIGVNVGNAVLNNLRYSFSLKNVALLQPDKTKLNGYFLESLLNFDKFKNNLVDISSQGGAQKFISLEILRSVHIFSPPLPLQEKFAAIVQKFERIRRQQREATRQAEHLFQTLLHRAFRGEL